MRRADGTEGPGSPGAWYASEIFSYHSQDERGVELIVRLHTGQTLDLWLVIEREGDDHPEDWALVLAADGGTAEAKEATSR